MIAPFTFLRNFRILVLVSVVTWSCQTEPEPIITPVQPKPAPILNGPADMALFDGLDGRVMGYQYITMKDGEVVTARAGGFARNVADGADEMTNDHTFNLASISKFITTVAVLQQLEKYGLSVEDSVGPYLPKDWELGEGMAAVKMIELLNHTAGMVKVGEQTFVANRYDSLEHFVREGTSNSLRFPKYSNTHHALFRVILPILVDSMTLDTDQESDPFTLAEYERIVQEELLEPLDIEGQLRLFSDDISLAYQDSGDRGRGQGAGVNYAGVGGGYGWHMSSNDLAILWSKVWYTEDIISAESREIMRTSLAGLFETRFAPSTNYFTKDGWWWWGGSVEKHYYCVAVHFDNGYDLIIMVNSRFNSIRNFAWGMADELISGEGA